MRQPPYKALGAIADVWRCRDPEVLVPGPAGTGKTRGILEKVHAYLMKHAGTRGLIVRKTRASMTESVLVTYETSVVHGGECNINNQSRRSRWSYDYANGSTLVVGGLDNPDRIMSTEFDIVAAFEATELTENDWELLTTRLRNARGPYHQILADCNPASPTHWLKRRADRGQMSVFNARHQDNPMLWDHARGDWTDRGRAYIDRLGKLTGHRRLRLLEGRWAAAEGLVYPEFDAAVHVIRSMPPEWNAWPRMRSIDFGFIHPFVCQWFAIDPDGRLYLYREIYHSKRTVADHARQIVALSSGETYVATVTDHDAEDRATLAVAGIQTTPANKDHRTGRDAVHDRLKVQADGRPRLYVLDGCTVETDMDLYHAKRPTCTLAEFDAYVYPPGMDGRAAKEDPVKANDDGMDAMRYAVMHVDGPKASHGAWIGSVREASTLTQARGWA